MRIALTSVLEPSKKKRAKKNSKSRHYLVEFVKWRVVLSSSCRVCNGSQPPHVSILHFRNVVYARSLSEMCAARHGMVQVACGCAVHTVFACLFFPVAPQMFFSAGVAACPVRLIKLSYKASCRVSYFHISIRDCLKLLYSTQPILGPMQKFCWVWAGPETGWSKLDIS